MVKWLLISARVRISRSMSSSPSSGSVLTAWSLLGILSPSLSPPPKKKKKANERKQGLENLMAASRRAFRGRGETGI